MAAEPQASIIIPAHNESGVIARTLTTLLGQAEPGEFEVVVVCNGSSDDTESAAHAVGSADVRVLSIPEASKSKALNAGDSAAQAFPRLYLDADVELSTESARRMIQALHSADSVVASPAFRLEGCRPLARAYWTEWQRRNPSLRAGTGCFGLSRRARQSFGEFPDIIGDDIWIATTFTPQPVPGAVTQVRVARTMPAILRRRVRVTRGNRQLRSSGVDVASGAGHREHASDKRQGRNALGAGILIGTHAVATVWGLAAPSGGWGQDRTSRR